MEMVTLAGAPPPLVTIIMSAGSGKTTAAKKRQGSGGYDIDDLVKQYNTPEDWARKKVLIRAALKTGSWREHASLYRVMLQNASQGLRRSGMIKGTTYVFLHSERCSKDFSDGWTLERSYVLRPSKELHEAGIRNRTASHQEVSRANYRSLVNLAAFEYDSWLALDARLDWIFAGSPRHVLGPGDRDRLGPLAMIGDKMLLLSDESQRGVTSRFPELATAQNQILGIYPKSGLVYGRQFNSTNRSDLLAISGSYVLLDHGPNLYGELTRLYLAGSSPEGQPNREDGTQEPGTSRGRRKEIGYPRA